MCRMFEDGALGVFYGGPWCSAADLKHCQSLPTTHTRPVGIRPLQKDAAHLFAFFSVPGSGKPGPCSFLGRAEGFFF